jgi:hypothetical protein
MDTTLLNNTTARVQARRSMAEHTLNHEQQQTQRNSHFLIFSAVKCGVTMRSIVGGHQYRNGGNRIHRKVGNRRQNYTASIHKTIQFPEIINSSFIFSR